MMRDQTFSPAVAHYLEAIDQGRTWNVVIISAGASKNRVFYPDRVLRDAAPLFEGVKVYARPDAEHRRGASPDINQLAGWIDGVKFVAGDAPDTGMLTGVLHITGMSELRDKITDAWNRGKRDFVALSIDAVGKAKKLPVPRADGVTKIAETIERVSSVDLIVEPGAGGSLVQLIEGAPPYGVRADIRIEEPEGGRRPCLADEIFDRFFAPRGMALSFKEAYIRVTGDRRVTGRLDDCSEAAMREALDTNTLGDVLSAAMRRRLVAEYRGMEERWALWRKLVRVAPAFDFRTQRRTRFGGYADPLPTVLQGAAYTALASPPDEQATYAITKRGGTESLTLEAIRNDDINAIRLIPKRLAETAQRTLARFVLDFLLSNPVIYDGVALFHAARGNLGAAALSAASLNAGRTALGKQTELGSGEQLRIKPRYLVVPLDLEETAFNLFQRGENNDKTFVQDLNLEVLPIWYWTDANDWVLSGDPETVPSIEVGFLDGQDEPELFVQDMPGVGSLFANDQMTFKIRHIYGGAVVDFRGLFKAVVA